MWPFLRRKLRPEAPAIVEEAPAAAIVARTSKDRDHLTDAERTTFRDGRCPDCDSTRILEGPSGGMCTNYACGDCGSRFNEMGPFGVQRISDAGRRTRVDSIEQYRR